MSSCRRVLRTSWRMPTYASSIKTLPNYNDEVKARENACLYGVNRLLVIPMPHFPRGAVSSKLKDMNYTAEQSPLAHFLTRSTASAPLWLIVRLYLGYVWLMGGWEKVTNPAWFGSDAGAALNGFVQGALAKTAGLHPDVQMWYASFLQNAVSSNLTLWSNVVAVGEVLVGLGLLVGLFTGVAAFFGFFMNLNFMLAGTVSLNPIWMLLAVGLMLAHRVAGHYGLDRYALPYLRRTFRRRTP